MNRKLRLAAIEVCSRTTGSGHKAFRRRFAPFGAMSGHRLKIFGSLVLIGWLGLGAVMAGADEAGDRVERATGLMKVTGDRFIVDLKYAGTDNFLKKDVYSPFDLKACYVHPEMHAKLKRLEPLLEKEELRLIVFDCYRPLEVQKAMWAIMPDRRYVANPATGSLHNRGAAIDCALADANGEPLEFPTPFDDFSKKAWPGYQCPANNNTPCHNRDQLDQLMRSVGFQGITSEWWHFQLPEAKKYPILSLDGSQK